MPPHRASGMIARMSGIYDEPELYQLACAYRDVTVEVSAMLSWCATHWRDTADGAREEDAGEEGTGEGATGGVRSVLELAAGPAEHALEFARHGLRATALDRSTAMCGFAAARAAAAGLALDVIEADMRNFSIPKRFDLAITMLNSVCHLFTLDDLIAHLSAVAAHLVPGGLYIVELAHPADYLAPVPRTSSDWTVEQGGIRAEVRWGGHQDRIDPVSQITPEHMTITAHGADGTVRTVSDIVPNRFWTATEMAAAVRLAGGFGLAASYGDFDAATMLDDPAAWRMILVLRRACG
jgi:SAM-dependent methyltransferase